jgi:hypothetical protein
VSTHISDKTDFKLKLVRRAKEGNFILTKGRIYYKEITIINLNAPNGGAPNFIKHTLLDLRAQIDPNTMIVGDLNTQLSKIDGSSRQEK